MWKKLVLPWMVNPDQGLITLAHRRPPRVSLSLKERSGVLLTHTCGVLTASPRQRLSASAQSNPLKAECMY